MKATKVLGMALLGMSIIMASCTGDQGERGPKGDSIKGDSGAPGKDGIACWDTDKSGVGEPSEDINQDGVFDALDCQGAPGNDGQDGSDKPNMEFYFQDGFKGYDGTHDAYISGQATFTNFGGNHVFRVSHDNNNQTIKRNSVIRFAGIDDITTDLVEGSETCTDGFYINKATLYVYLSSYTKTGVGIYQPAIQLYCGFYNGGTNDPMFEQMEATWFLGNADTNWFVEGGQSFLFDYGLNTGNDDYIVPIQFNELAEGSGTVGWVAIPLPRSLMNQWICNPEENKGMRLRIDETELNSDEVVLEFISSDNPNKMDLRPLLVIETEDVDPAAGKMAPSSKAKDWDSMSYEEKMAPLYRYFAAKEAN
ncbi:MULTISPECIES: hypothetical protein [Flavobacteriaceae]|uniref:hypothetical protein n=1 Tax=Flavobacteriaceae TaxID=49546 RepID=UPI002348F0E2|nr:hypothetical protein [Muricauda sp. SP22]MDC6361941.1 hypothetical protein [Muricauda sp. SP22]